MLPTKSKLVFFISTAVGFLIPTLLSFYLYGQIYIDEAWLYHFVRQDIQHNFSPYFYFYSISSNPSYRQILSLFAFVPQFVLILASAFYYLFDSKLKRDLFMSLFVQTYIFVTLNKVITAQYFEWYMCFLPLIMPFFDLSLLKWVKIFIFWSFSILQWLLPAYLFEFRKCTSCFKWVGYSSIAFVFIHISILIYIICKFNSKMKQKII